MIGKLHPTAQANSWKSLEKFMFRFPFADAPRLPQFTQCKEAAKKPRRRAHSVCRCGHGTRSVPTTAICLLSVIGGTCEPAAPARAGLEIANDQVKVKVPLSPRCPLQKNAARREVAGSLFGWTNRIKS